MTMFSGWAYSIKSEEISEKYLQRYECLSQWVRDHIDLNKEQGLDVVHFYGKLKTDRSRSLSELDLALIADKGNLCFGGKCTIFSDGSFTGCYYKG